MSTNTEPTTTIGRVLDMTKDRYLQVSVLDIMPPSLWHIWMISAFSALSLYADHQEYEEFLKRFSFILEQRVETGVW